MLIIVIVVVLLALVGGGIAVVATSGTTTTTTTTTTSTSTSSTTTTTTPTSTPPGPARIIDLQPGTCFDHPDLQGVINGTVTEEQDVTVVTCETPHELEVIGREDVANTTERGRQPYPGEDALISQAEQLCTSSFPSYIGTPIDSSTLSGIYVFPSAEEWRDLRNQYVVCAAHTVDGSLLTGSVQGSER